MKKKIAIDITGVLLIILICWTCDNTIKTKTKLFLDQDGYCKFRLTLDGEAQEIEARGGQGAQNAFHILNLSGEIHSLKIEVFEGQISFDSIIIKP